MNIADGEVLKIGADLKVVCSSNVRVSSGQCESKVIRGFQVGLLEGLICNKNIKNGNKSKTQVTNIRIKGKNETTYQYADAEIRWIRKA